MLIEMDFYDRSPLTAVLKAHRGKWIHFSRGAPNRDWQTIKRLPDPEKPAYYDRYKTKQYKRDLAAVQRKNATHPVPKMGINPKSMWSDPKGVYFYPTDWLLSGPERVRNLNQYGMDYPFYYICDLNLNDPNGIDLGTMTWEQVEAIAKRNGWFEQMQEFRQLPPEEQKTKLFSYSRPDLPGSFFWHFIDRMVKDGKITWTKAYKGVSYIRDPGLSIIHSNEPNQVLVLDPKIIKIITMGENKNPLKPTGQDELGQWMHALLSIIKAVRGEMGGALTWQKKRPILNFEAGWGKFELTISTRTGGEMEPGLSLTYRYGRAEDSMTFNRQNLSESTVEQIVGRIVGRARQIAARKTDLLFKPFMSVEEGQRFMLNKMLDGREGTIKTTIYNSDNAKWPSSLSLHGDVAFEADRVRFEVKPYMMIYPDHFHASINVHAGRHGLIYGTTPYGENWTDPEAAMKAMADAMAESFNNMARQFGPQQSSRYRSHPVLGSDEELAAFKGWVILNCGVSLQGVLREHFAAEIAAFEAYKDKRVLLSDIAYVLNSRY